MKLNTKSGFSLIELMVVVAIIGILVTIAAPNLTSFQAKAKQTAAKTELSALYTTEKAYFTEFSSYHASLPVIGHIPDGIRPGATAGTYEIGDGVTRYYAVGFTGSANVNYFSEKLGSVTPTLAPPSTAVVNGSAGFIAAAVGKIGNATNDTWRINENRELVNSAPGATPSPTPTP